MCLAIDAISCSSTFLSADKVKESDDLHVFLVNLEPLHSDVKCHSLFWVSSKTGNGSDIQGTFDQIHISVNTQIPVPALSSNGEPSYSFRHDAFFMWWVHRHQENEPKLGELLNSMHGSSKWPIAYGKEFSFSGSQMCCHDARPQ
jgi:hypothetical protein